MFINRIIFVEYRLLNCFAFVKSIRYTERCEHDRRRNRAQSNREEDRGKDGDLGKTRAANAAEGRTGRYNRQNQLRR